MLYIFSDGYVDQFGGEKGKKFTTKRWKDTLASIASLPVDEQYNRVRNTFESWKAHYEQVDDILVIGVKI